MVVYDAQGELRPYDPTETVQRQNICRPVSAPVRASEYDVVHTHAFAVDVVRAFAGAGVSGVKLFLFEDGEAVVNGIAPRVHRGGCWTEARYTTSQFENHIRTVLGCPLGSIAVPAR